MTKPLPTRPGPALLLEMPYLLLILTPLFWGGNTVAGKMAVGEVDPFVLIIGRWLGALIVIAPFALPRLVRDWPEIRRAWPLFLLYGAIGYASFNALMYVAVHYTSAVNASVEQCLIPVLVMLGNFVVFRVRATLLQLAGVALTMVGVGVTAIHGQFGQIASLTLNRGDAMMLLACVGYAAHSIGLRFRPAVSWPSFLFVSFFIATVTGFAEQAIFDNGTANLVHNVAAATPEGWAIVAYAALFPSVIAQLFFARGVELVGPNRASLFINLIPVFGALGSVVILFEPIEPYHLVTAALVAVGIVLAERSARQIARDGAP